LRPTPLVQGTVALGLGAVAGDELGHGQASLELHGIDAHDATSSPSGGRMLGGGRRTSCDWRLRVGANQVPTSNSHGDAYNENNLGQLI